MQVNLHFKKKILNVMLSKNCLLTIVSQDVLFLNDFF